MKSIAITAGIGLLVALFQQIYIANLHTDIAELDKTLTEYESAIGTQNNANQNLANAEQLENTQAASRAANVLLEGERLKATLPKGTGPKAMNEFMQAVFP